jgi:protein gp37
MGENSKISWCHHTMNIVWGCHKVSEGCTHCYAETFSKRVGLKVWGAGADRRVFGENHWREPLKWDLAANRADERHRVFCSSMADVFEDHPIVAEERKKLWSLIVATPHLDWLLLTKRPENMIRFAADAWGAKWPSNVWAGCTAENQQRWNERLVELVQVPAAVRFVSCEPLLGQISTGPFLREHVCDEWPNADEHGCVAHSMPGIDWIIAGAESGHGRRPMREEWVRSLRDQCIAADKAFFFKQTVDDHGKKTELPLLDGRQWAEFPEASAA